MTRKTHTAAEQKKIDIITEYLTGEDVIVEYLTGRRFGFRHVWVGNTMAFAHSEPGDTRYYLTTITAKDMLAWYDMAARFLADNPDCGYDMKTALYETERGNIDNVGNVERIRELDIAEATRPLRSPKRRAA